MPFPAVWVLLPPLGRNGNLCIRSQDAHHRYNQKPLKSRIATAYYRHEYIDRVFCECLKGDRNYPQGLGGMLLPPSKLVGGCKQCLHNAHTG
jgi:hypothetical protein